MVILLCLFIQFSEVHGLVACGGEDGAIECFDMREKSSVGRINTDDDQVWNAIGSEGLYHIIFSALVDLDIKLFNLSEDGIAHILTPNAPSPVYVGSEFSIVLI